MNKDSNISIFNNDRFGSIRTTVDENGEPRFCLKDVCDCLGLQSKHTIERLGDEVVSTDLISDSMGRMQLMNFVNEDGLYDVIFDSRKPEAKAFRKWVTSEVLPNIRKHGGYLVRRPDDTPEQIITRALNVAAETLEQLMEQNQRLKSENDHYSAIFNTKDTVTTTEMASKFGMSAKKLNKIIEDMGIQYRQNGRWYLYEAYKGLGLTDDKTYTIGEGDEARLKTSMHWTPKGIEFISNQLQKIQLAN